MNDEPNSLLTLENQVCFPLYSAANAVVRAYRPLLAELDLTYLQYLVLMVLWREKETHVKALGQCLHLDSGTLTPLLKRLASKGLIERRRSEQDERVTLIRLTESGAQLEEKALHIPVTLAQHSPLSLEEAAQLKALCEKLMNG